ncbi:hypothetical protein CPB86DRAFT_869655 [Serendipita vermifera]|nr:hypothetical protein CPB86DRAFT_869655 [Serendipita vermifera]
MSTTDALDPLQAIAATANDLFDILEICLGPSTPSDEKNQLEPLELVLPNAPSPAPSLRALGLSKGLTKKLKKMFYERIQELRETTIEEFRLAESSLKSTIVQARLAQVFVGSFTRAMHDSFEQMIDSALDFLTITRSEQSSISPKTKKEKSRFKKGKSSLGESSSPTGQVNPTPASIPDQSASSSGSSDESLASGSSGVSSTSGNLPIPSSGAFDKSAVPLFEYIFSHENNHYPSIEEKKVLQAKTGLTYRQVAVWFQNRRAREKKRIKEGKGPIPIEVEETVVRLEEVVEQEILQPQAPEKRRIHLIQMIIRQEELPVEDDHEFDPRDIDFSPRDEFELQERERYLRGEIENLDIWTPSPGSFPKRFRQPIYSRPTFDPPEWIRSPPSDNPDLAAVEHDTMDALSEQLGNMKIQLTETMIIKKRRHAVITIPDDPILASHLRERVEAMATLQDVKDSMETWLTTDIKSILDSVVAAVQLQAQIESQETVDQEGQSSATPTEDSKESPEDKSKSDVPKCDPAVAHLSSDPSPYLPDSPASQSTDSLVTAESSAAVQTPLDEYIPLPDMEDVSDLVRVSASEHCHAAFYAAQYSPAIDTTPEVSNDADTLNEVLKMTLDELGYTGPFLENEPFIYNYYPSFKPDFFKDYSLKYLQEIYAYHDRETALPPDAAFVDIGVPVAYDLFEADQQSEELPAPDSEPFPYFPTLNDFVYTDHNADINVAPHFGQIDDPSLATLPFAYLAPDTRPQDPFTFIDLTSFDFAASGSYHSTFGDLGDSLSWNVPDQNECEDNGPHSILPVSEITDPVSSASLEPSNITGWGRLKRSVMSFVDQAKQKVQRQNSISPESMLQYLVDF